MKKFLLLTIFMVNAAAAQQWTDNLAAALQQANGSDKRILLYFSVSDFCQPCRDLEEKVFDSKEFKAFAEANYILVRPEFIENESIEAKADKLMIVEKYNKDGFFPLVVILDRNSRVVGKTGAYNGEFPNEYIRILKNLGHE